MTDREVMKMALDYIKETYNFCVVMQQPKEQEEQLIKALEAALAQPEQESGKCGCGANLYINEYGKPCSKALAQPEQEPVAWMQDSIELYANDRPTEIYKIPLYTAPPKREWVGLTDNDIWAADGCDDLVWARNIEAKLRERNT